MRHPGRRNTRRRGSCTRPGAFIARCTGSVAAYFCGSRRTSEAGARCALTTIGRKSGQERSVIIGYLEDGPNLVAIAMNGWDEGHPAWWRNLEAHPDAVIRLAHQQPRLVRARPSAGEERDRLWQRWVAVDPRLDAYAVRRSTETSVIVLEPRTGPVDVGR
jgi:deazaflavin-dependent oxidoreductase (nitroreductase family)